MTPLRSLPGRSAVALIAALLVAGACGSTRSQKELAGAAQSTPSARTNLPAAAPTEEGHTTPDTAPPGAAHVGAGPSAATVAVPRTTSPNRPSASGSGTVTQAPVQPGAKASPSVAREHPQPAESPSRPAVPSSPPPPPNSPEPGAPPAGAPIILGSIGSDSGVLGQILLPVLSGAKAWVADVNARGGLNGHPVKVLFVDDGGDPGRALGLAKRLVDQDGAVAFYAERGPAIRSGGQRLPRAEEDPGHRRLRMQRLGGHEPDVIHGRSRR